MKPCVYKILGTSIIKLDLMNVTSRKMAMNEKKMAATMLECPYPKQIMDIKYVDILTKGKGGGRLC